MAIDEEDRASVLPVRIGIDQDAVRDDFVSSRGRAFLNHFLRRVSYFVEGALAGDRVAVFKLGGEGPEVQVRTRERELVRSQPQTGMAGYVGVIVRSAISRAEIERAVGAHVGIQQRP